MNKLQEIIGSPTKDIVIQTRGKVWIQVGDTKYELKYK